MQSKLAPFLVASLALHIALAVYFQSKKSAPPPPIKLNKALVHTVYLKPEVPKKNVPKKVPPPVAKTVKKVDTSKPKQTVAKTTKKTSPPKQEVAKAVKPQKTTPVISKAYAEEIAMQLKLLLSLPEYGAVKLSITLSPAGEVTRIEILDSQSSVNEKYLLTTLPKVKLPAPPNGETPLKLTLSNA